MLLEIPDKYVTIMQDLLKQVESLDGSLGGQIPELKLTTKENYLKLVNQLKIYSGEIKN